MKKEFKILVVEDEELTAGKIEMQIDKLGHVHYGTVNNAESALKILEKELPDLILMDVNIEGNYDGIELTDLIHSRWPVPVIFITSLHDDNTFRRITRTNPLGYIVKPFDEIQLQRSIELVINQLSNSSNGKPYEMSSNELLDKDHFFIRHGKKLEKLKIEEIFFLEADGRYCRIQMIEKKFLVQFPLKEMLDRLPEKRFIQTHRSFVVNINKIKAINLEEGVIILDNMHIPISRREKESVLKKINWIK